LLFAGVLVASLSQQGNVFLLMAKFIVTMANFSWSHFSFAVFPDFSGPY